MLIKQWENLKGEEMRSKSKLKFCLNLIPHVLLDLSMDASMARHFEEAGLPLVEVIEGCCHVNSSSPKLIVQQAINYPGYIFRFRCKQLMVN